MSMVESSQRCCSFYTYNNNFNTAPPITGLGNTSSEPQTLIVGSNRRSCRDQAPFNFPKPYVFTTEYGGVASGQPHPTPFHQRSALSALRVAYISAIRLTSMEGPEPSETAFGAVSAQTTRFQRLYQTYLVGTSSITSDRTASTQCGRC